MVTGTIRIEGEAFWRIVQNILMSEVEEYLYIFGGGDE